MRYLLLISYWLLTSVASAQQAADLRLIQAHANLPAIKLWLDLPAAASAIKAEQFVVSIGPHPAEITAVETFRQTDEGVAYIFLVDISKSLSAKQFGQIQSALHQWLDGMRPEDRAALISFGSEVNQRLGFSADLNRLRQVIDGLAVSDQETSLYRGLLEAISLGRRQDADLPARRAIIVLSDGIDDTLNGVTLEEVFKQSQEYRVPIYSIGFAAPPLNDDKRQGLKVLGVLARQSGGYFVQAEAGQLNSAYQQQQQHIMQAYRLNLNCADCIADGQAYRLNLTWNDGLRTLNDGFDLRLLPQSRHGSADSAAEKPQGISNPLFILGAGFLLLTGLLILLIRDRLKPHPAEESSAPISANPPRIKPQAANPATGIELQLTVVAGLQKGLVYKVRAAERTILGRAPSCDLSIGDDVEISSQHAVLQFKAGQLQVRDLHSTNGTLVNGVPIHNDFPLRHGDLLLLGRTELRVTLPIPKP